MARTDYDLITIGGGIAASSLAKVVAEAGHRVLVVERETAFRDRVRGEYMAPWGVAETQTLSVYDTLKAAGAHDVPKFEFRFGPPSEPRDYRSTTPLQLPALSFYHPAVQEALIEAALGAGAEVRRGATVTGVQPGSPPTVDVRNGDGHTTLSARLIVGADGRSARSRHAFQAQPHPQHAPRFIAGVLLDSVAAPEDTALAAVDLNNGRVGLIFPQGNGRARAYSGFRGDDAERLDGPDAYDRFVDACVASGVDPASYANATVQGPLATFECAAEFVPHPHRDGVALIGDAATTTDPSWGQGLGMGFRDARVLSHHLLSHDDWPAAADRYAEEHDRDVNVMINVETWLTQLFLDGGPEAESRRAQALPLIMTDPTRIPNHLNSGPELPFDDSIRSRLFGEE